ncbi:MAG: thioredoxin-disulfide reductase [Candidatus Micrarchaeia archaeon]
MIEDLIIIGAGPAGYTAAIYAARDGFNPLVVSGLEPGGQLLLTTTVENFPGFPEGVEGSQLMDLFKKQAEKFGARFVFDEVKEIDFDAKPFKVKTGAADYEANALIIATGAKARWLGLESEKKFIGKGVSSCATCDAPFFKNKDVVVVGGGDTAMEDSLYLTNFAKSVTIVHRRDQFRASKIMQERVFSNSKIKIIWDNVVEEILGDSKLTGVKIKNVKTNEEKVLRVDGVFVAIGYEPITKFLNGKIETDELGYIKARDEVKTNIEGVFVAGDVADRLYRQAITAAGSGAKAALEARAYLQKLHASDEHAQS